VCSRLGVVVGERGIFLVLVVVVIGERSSK